jgi:CubicO group peptidase (beta-lactamase class C family)
MRMFVLPIVLAAVSCATSSELPTAQSATDPARAWQQYVDVRQAGFDPAALQAACKRADELRSGAVMAVFRGHVILACGDVSREFESHSIRKSLVSGLFGTAIARGEIDLDDTLADISINDQTPLTDAERSATVRHIISARSGVYLPAAYGASQDSRRPARGSHAPGTRWFYNNWDFNIAGVVYERVTREDLYESFQQRLAKPLGMEDWTPSDGFRVYEPTKSQHPAHTFRISARDLVRFGQLYLQRGRWDGQQIVSADWVTESTRPHTDDGDGTGYGYMWWTYQAGSQFTAKYPTLTKHTFYRALGTGDQGLWVIPGAELVVVHRADTDHDRRVSGDDHWALVESLLAARRSEPLATPKLGPLQATVLVSQLPPAAVPEYQAPATGALDRFLGDYQLRPGSTTLGSYTMTSGGTVRVSLFDEKPYAHLPGVGDVQLFPSNRPGVFAVRILLGLEFAFESGTGGSSVTISLDDDKVRASRVR